MMSTTAARTTGAGSAGARRAERTGITESAGRRSHGRRQVLAFGVATILLVLSDALPPLTEAAWIALGLLALIGV